MKKVIIAIILIAIIVAVILLLLNNNKVTEVATEEEEVTTYDNEYYEVGDAFEDIMQNTMLGIPLEEEVNYNQITEDISFADLEGDYSSASVGRYNDNSFTVAWIIKVQNENDEKIVLKRIDDYVNELKQNYSSNEFANAVLSSDSNIKIHIENGIILLVIAPDASAIMGRMQTSIIAQAVPKPASFPNENVTPNEIENEIIETEENSFETESVVE